MIFRGRLQGRLARRARDKPADSYPDSPWALLLALGILGVGVAFALVGRWRMASLLIGTSLLAAALLRLVLPTLAAGLLVVRRRWIDVTVMALLGLSIMAMAIWVPPAAP